MSERVLDRHIESSPQIASGKPRIVGRRLTVHNIAVWHERLGLNADEIASEYDLSLAEIYAALTYYFDHRDEIDRELREDGAFAEALRASTPPRLPKRLLEQVGEGEA